MKYDITPETVAFALVSPSKRPAFSDLPHVPLGTLKKVRVTELRRVFGRMGAYYLARQAGGSVTVVDVLARAQALTEQETVLAASKRHGIHVRLMHKWLADAGVIAPKGERGHRGMAVGAKWHRVPKTEVDRVVREATRQKALARVDEAIARQESQRALAEAKTCGCGGEKCSTAPRCKGCYGRANHTVSDDVVREIFTSPDPYGVGKALGLTSGTVQHLLHRQTYRDVTEGLVRVFRFASEQRAEQMARAGVAA